MVNNNLFRCVRKIGVKPEWVGDLKSSINNCPELQAQEAVVSSHKSKQHFKKVVDVYGIKLSELDSMMFSKYLSNNPKLPAPNTISAIERKQLVIDFLNSKNKADEL